MDYFINFTDPNDNKTKLKFRLPKGLRDGWSMQLLDLQQRIKNMPSK